jgi:ATP-dependent RNA helicase DDX51/DBP6
VQDGSDPTSSLSESFALPSTLSEKYLVVPPQLKPLNLVHLCHALGVSNGLVFTKSVESVGRLVALLNFFEESYAAKKRVVIRGYTAEMKPGERKAVLADFVAGKVHL